MSTADSDAKPTGTVARISDLVRYLAEQDSEVAVTVAARDLGLPPSTVHRLLQLLMKQGFVERGERFQSYRIGAELYRISCLLSRKVGLAELADPIMRELSETSGEFCMLTVYLPIGHKLTLVHTVVPPNPQISGTDMFAPLTLAWGASGRAILASLNENVIREVYAHAGASPITDRELPGYGEFREELRTIATKGYALTHAQRVAGVVGMAVPFGNSLGRPVGSLCLSIPQQGFDAARERDLARTLKERAATLGYIRARHSSATALEDHGGRFVPTKTDLSCRTLRQAAPTVQ